MKITINFVSIRTVTDFYKQLQQKMKLPAHFGENLDALHDVISGDIEMPLEITFLNVSDEKKITFQSIIETMEQLMEEVQGFTFRLNISHSVFDIS